MEVNSPMIEVRCPECNHKLLDIKEPNTTIEAEIKCAKCKSIIVVQAYSDGHGARTKRVGRLVDKVWKPTDYKGE